MQLKRFGVPGAGDRRRTSVRWLACARWSLAAGPLLAACAGPPVSTSRPTDADETAPVAAPRRTAETIESANPLGVQGVEEVSGDRSGGATTSPADAQNAEAATESGTGPHAVAQPDATGQEEAVAMTESPETTGGDADDRLAVGGADAPATESPETMGRDAGDQLAVGAVGVGATESSETTGRDADDQLAVGGADLAATESPDTTDDAEAQASSGSPVTTSAAGHGSPEPVLLVEPDVLPAEWPVTGVEAKLDGVLLELVRARREGGETGLLAYVERHRQGLSPERLPVQIVCESIGAVAAVREQVAAAGGTVTTSFENHLWAELPLDGVEALAATEAIWTVAVSQAVVRPFGR